MGKNLFEISQSARNAYMIIERQRARLSFLTSIYDMGH